MYQQSFFLLSYPHPFPATILQPTPSYLLLSSVGCAMYFNIIKLSFPLLCFQVPDHQMPPLEAVFGLPQSLFSVCFSGSPSPWLHVSCGSHHTPFGDACVDRAFSSPGSSAPSGVSGLTNYLDILSVYSIVNLLTLSGYTLSATV